MKKVFYSLTLVVLGSISMLDVHAVEPGFIPLLDRDHTEGWKQCGPGGMNFKDGVATPWLPNKERLYYSVYWYAEKQFSDYVLRVEFKLDKLDSDSGVYPRLSCLADIEPRGIDDRNYQVQIKGDGVGSAATGAIMTFQAPTSTPLRRIGDWNEFEITAIGQRYVVKLNGQTINEFIGDRAVSGFIGLQEHKKGGVQFRNVRIRDLSSEQPAAANATTHKADEPQIRILSDESVNVTGWITSPLDVAVPEQIWENLNFMKEALKDEAAQKPVATPAAYQVGVRLCLKMLEHLEERNQVSARAGGAAVLHQKSNLTQQNRDHLTWPQYMLERDERAERQVNARNADKFMNGHIMIEWTGRAGNMRKEIQLLYSQFREALRQGPATK